MATFGFTKKVDDIEEPLLLPSDWYDAEICREPEVLPNGKLRDEVGEDASAEEMAEAIENVEGAGLNLVLRLETEHPDDIYNGRELTLWLPYPHPVDAERYNNKGQKVYDAKMSECLAFTEAFGGDISEDEDGNTVIELYKGLKGQVYVESQRALNSEEMVNVINRFEGFKPYGD